MRWGTTEIPRVCTIAVHNGTHIHTNSHTIHNCMPIRLQQSGEEIEENSTPKAGAEFKPLTLKASMQTTKPPCPLHTLYMTSLYVRRSLLNVFKNGKHSWLEGYGALCSKNAFLFQFISKYVGPQILYSWKQSGFGGFGLFSKFTLTVRTECICLQFKAISVLIMLQQHVPE